MSHFKFYRIGLLFFLSSLMGNAFAADSDVAINFNNQTGLFITRLADDNNELGKGFWCPALANISPGNNYAGLNGRYCGGGRGGPRSFIHNVTYGLQESSQQCTLTIQWNVPPFPEPPPPCGKRNVRAWATQTGGIICDVKILEQPSGSNNCTGIVNVNITSAQGLKH